MTHRLLLVTCLAFVAACGDSTNGDDQPAIDANGTAAPDSNPNIPDAGPVPTDGSVGVSCGAEECDPATQECCVTQGGGAQACVDTGTCTGESFQCDGIEDCPTAGDVCCFGAGGPQDPVSACTPSGDCDTPTCQTADDCPDPDNQLCCPLGVTSVCIEAPVCPAP